MLSAARLPARKKKKKGFFTALSTGLNFSDVAGTRALSSSIIDGFAYCFWP